MAFPNSKSIPQLTAEQGGFSSLDIMSKMILSAVDGTASIAKIADQIGLDEETAVKIAATLASKGLIAIPGYSPSTSSQEPAATDEKISRLEMEVDEAFKSLGLINLYDLLGVEPTADRQEIRSKYFELSKKFHPDKVHFKCSISLRQKMEKIFRCYTDAYNVLSSAKAREEYDTSIADELTLRDIESKLKKASSQNPKSPYSEKKESIPPGARSTPQTRKSNPSISARPLISSFPAKPVSRPAGPRTTPAIQQQQQASSISSQPERAAYTRSSEPPRIPSSNPPSDRLCHDAYEEQRKKWQRERANRAMATILNKESITPPHSAVDTKLLTEAQKALTYEKYQDAEKLLEDFLRLDPKNVQAAALLKEAKSKAATADAKKQLILGQREMKKGNFEAALSCFQNASKKDPNNLDARYLQAEAMLSEKRNLNLALDLVKKVISMGGKRARYFATLGEILLVADDRIRAADAFEKACAIEPYNKEYRKKLKLCRK